MSAPVEKSPGVWVWDYQGLRYGAQVQGNLVLAYTCDDPTDNPTRGTITGYRYKTGMVYFFGITAKSTTEEVLKDLIMQVWGNPPIYRGMTARG